MRSDISIDPEQNFANLSKNEIFKNFETLKRLRPDLNGSVAERESLFAGTSSIELNQKFRNWFFIFTHPKPLWNYHSFHIFFPKSVTIALAVVTYYIYFLVSKTPYLQAQSQQMHTSTGMELYKMNWLPNLWNTKEVQDQIFLFSTLSSR